MNGEVHIILLWPNALGRQDRILADMAAHFTRLGLLRVTWSETNFAANISRFYGKSLPIDSDKIAHCGTGPFLAAVVLDEAPVHAYRWTSKGARLVNTNLFDAKQRYRDWTGGGHRVHATDSAAEARHDAALLFGCPAADFLGQPEQSWEAPAEELSRDLSGADGWRDLTELFAILNETHPYVVLRNFEDLPGDMGDEEHGDIDILVEDLDEAVFIANAKAATDTPGRVFMHVNVAGRDAPFDIRYLGDDYYDRLWQRGILDKRMLADGGFYIPAPDDHFYSLLYHGVIHKPQVAADYLVTLTDLAQSLGRAEASPAHFTDYRWMMGLLNQFFRARGYEFTEPKDPSVYVNRRMLGDSPEAMENRFQIILEATLMTPPRHAKRNQEFFTQVWRMTMPDGSEAALKLIEVLSEEARPLLFREHEFLERLKDGPFARHLAHGELNGKYFLLSRWIDGFDLRPSPELDALLADRQGRARLETGCRDMAAGLKSAGIRHRDIREMNILIEDGAPVLIDFGWSAMEGEADIYTPENLEEPDDNRALEQMLGRVLGR